MPEKFNEKYSLTVEQKGGDTFLHVQLSHPKNALTAEDIDRIREVAKIKSQEIRREIRYLVINGFRIEVSDSESGRHTRISIPRRDPPIARLPKKGGKALGVHRSQIFVEEDGVREGVYPNADDLNKGISLPVDSSLFQANEDN